MSSWIEYFGAYGFGVDRGRNTWAYTYGTRGPGIGMRLASILTIHFASSIRILETQQIDFSAMEDVEIKPGWNVYLDNVSVGFIEEAASPLELTGIAAAEGYHVLDVRRSWGFWTARNPDWAVVFEVDALGDVLAAAPDEILNLRGQYILDDVFDANIEWDYAARFGSAEPERFDIWMNAVTPVDTSGAADATELYRGEGAHQAFLTLGSTKYVAVRAATAGNDYGPVSEVLITIPTVSETAPDNQYPSNVPEYTQEAS